MSSGLRELFLLGVRTAWGFIDEFTPNRTIDEVARLIENMRSEMFDASEEELRTRLDAQVLAVREARTVLAQSGGSEDVVRILGERISLLERLQAPIIVERDAYGGSLGMETGGRAQRRETGPEWQPVEGHPSTVGFVGQLVRAGAQRVFERRDLREQTIQLRTQIQAQKNTLLEVRDLLAPESREVFDARLAALDMVEQALSSEAQPSAMDGRPEARGTTVRTSRPRERFREEEGLGRASMRRQEIDIEFE